MPLVLSLGPWPNERTLPAFATLSKTMKDLSITEDLAWIQSRYLLEYEATSLPLHQHVFYIAIKLLKSYIVQGRISMVWAVCSCECCLSEIGRY